MEFQAVLNVDVVLDSGINVPEYQTANSAGVDLRSNEETVLVPFVPRVVGTGMKIAIPEGYMGHVCSRSGLASKGVFVVNAPGIIDADYRGEIKSILMYIPASGNPIDSPFVINEGDRIAQLVFVPYIQASFSMVDDLDETERGSGGLGSTGVK